MTKSSKPPEPKKGSYEDWATNVGNKRDDERREREAQRKGK